MRKRLFSIVEKECPRSAEVTPIERIEVPEEKWVSSSDEENDYPAIIKIESEETESDKIQPVMKGKKNTAKSGGLRSFMIIKRRRSLN